MSFVSEIDRYKQLVKEAKTLKEDIADIAINKGVPIEAGSDTITSVVEKLINIPSQIKTVTPSANEQVVTADSGYILEKVVINPADNSVDKDIVPENIKSGVSILGVQGTFLGGKYDVESIVNEDGTQTIQIKDYLLYQREFSLNTPNTISRVSAEISANNMTSEQVATTYGWHIGDTINIPLSNGETIEMRIVGINHDDKSDGTGKAGITLEMTHSFATTYAYDVEGFTGGYYNSNMRTSILPTLKALLPQEWQDVIVTVDKISADADGDNYATTVLTQDDIFLFSNVEIDGTGNVAVAGVLEGNQYEYYIGSDYSMRTKYRDSNGDGTLDSSYPWWTRSSAITIGFCTQPSGASGVTLENTVSFGFCV